MCLPFPCLPAYTQLFYSCPFLSRKLPLFFTVSNPVFRLPFPSDLPSLGVVLEPLECVDLIVGFNLRIFFCPRVLESPVWTSHEEFRFRKLF